jgi:hypothetical protein
MLEVDYVCMANLAQFDMGIRGREARIRALLEDVTQYHRGIYPQNLLALAVWFGRSPEGQEQRLLELFSGLPNDGFANTRFSLLWKTGVERPPFVNIRATSVEHFSRLLRESPEQLAPYKENYEVLYFDKRLVSPDILDVFDVITEPPGLIKGWYITESEYEKSKSIQGLASLHEHARPEFGLVKLEESADFENSRGVLHVEVTQKWLPISPEGIRAYTYYNDYQAGRYVYFLFEGGALYKVLKFEVKTAPEYAGRLLGKTPDDRYPEVYLRAVHPLAQPAA